jgi:SAM-dependent methyltransferase
MKEIHRVLAPGGILLSHTPSTDGRGAWQDPTHVSFWNENSFWYWTRPQQMQYIRNKHIRFFESSLLTHFPSEWHKQHNISYVEAFLEKI